MTQIMLIVGLGNPEFRYEQTRHNAGFWFIDELGRHNSLRFKFDSRFQGESAITQIDTSSVRVLRPRTFMNQSGQSVVPMMRYFNIQPTSVLVVHDDLDLDPGVVRLKKGGGHGGHNGLRDLINHMGSRDFFRLRLGIGHPGNSDEVTDYVLHKPLPEQRLAILGAITRSVGLIDSIISGDHAKVMNNLHSIEN